MYIPKHNAYFFHTPKAGGTSVELFFLNDDGVKISHYNLSKHLSKDQKEKYKIATKWNPFPYASQHATCECVTQTDIWKKVNYSFTIVRNPWDRVISEWKYLQQEMKEQVTLDTVIDRYILEHSAHFIPQWKYAYINDNLIVDDVFKLEEIHIAEEKLSNQFNIDVHFSTSNKTTRNSDYRTYFNNDQQTRLSSVLSKDLELFNYKF